MNHSIRIARPLALAAALLSAAAPQAMAGRGGSFERIRSAAQHGNPDAIAAELERAENIPCTAPCMTFVEDLLDHDSYIVRDAAAWWFARRPAQRRAVAERALARLATGDSAAVLSAADAIARVGHPRVVPDLAAALERAGLSDEARAHMVRALGKLAHLSANPALAAAMADASPAVRREAALAWAAILRQSGADPVIGLVSDADASVRRDAAWALGRIGDDASRAALTAAADDGSSLVRMTARAALRRLR